MGSSVTCSFPTHKTVEMRTHIQFREPKCPRHLPDVCMLQMDKSKADEEEEMERVNLERDMKMGPPTDKDLIHSFGDDKVDDKSAEFVGHENEKTPNVNNGVNV